MHTIRLRAAWRLSDGHAIRSFNRPTGLDRGQTVWLAWDGAAQAAALNGEPLDPTAGRHDVTVRLRPGANELRLRGADAAVLESTRLEIEAI
ncbi:hypothetical protein [Botrimarina sp.]|uniref:hypothetical protein n=1 Tax=Botrimarina sp. TaxID=2795802 RepID=UPI0032EB7588